MSEVDWGICCVGCQCPRYQAHIQAFHPFLPGVLPPPHLQEKEQSVHFKETRFVQNSDSSDLSVFKQWMNIDSTFVIPSAKPKWNP